MVQVWAENLASLPSYPSTTLASLGRAGCPQDRSASLHILTSFHILIYSVNKELSQQWSSLSGVGGSESDPQPLWIHWIYSSGCVFSPDVYLMEEITSLQSASNSNEAEPDWGDIWTENTGDRMTESLFFSFLFCPFSFFLSFLLPSSLPPSLPPFSLSLSLSLPPSFQILLPESLHGKYRVSPPTLTMRGGRFQYTVKRFEWNCMIRWTLTLCQYSLVTRESKTPYFPQLWISQNSKIIKKWTNECERQRKEEEERRKGGRKEGREGITWISSLYLAKPGH